MHLYSKYILLVLLSSSCISPVQEDDSNTSVSMTQTTSKVKVGVEIVEHDLFFEEVRSNGLIKPQRTALLSFQQAGIVSECLLSNGKRVNKGTLLAVLDTSEIVEEVKYTQLEAFKAKSNLKDKLFTLGYKNLSDSSLLSPIQWKNLKLRSGVLEADFLLEKKYKAYKKHFVYAPFSGVIADTRQEAFNHVGLGEPLCLLIDESTFEVAFQIFEEDLPRITLGDSVQIRMNDLEIACTGKISSINPKSDEFGMILIKAEITESQSNIHTGQHVEIFVKKPLGKYYIVPKSAVQEQYNKHIVFTYSKGMAHWNYINIVAENTEYFAVSKGLERGDTIIVANHFDLADQTPVSL